MKRFLKNLTIKQIILIILGIVSLLIFLVLQIAGYLQTNSLEDQQMAQRWASDGSAAQISCFIAQGAEVEAEKFTFFEKQLDTILQDASVEKTNENARLWVSTYSATGEITVNNLKKTLKAKAIGVGGDFFLFHPLKLVSGRYFSGSDIMTDYIIIDEDAAWQLFGSNDVAGMQVEIGGIPHTIAGVIERASDKVSEAAGLDETTIYVSYNTLSTYGTSYGINSYEIVMPNPITGFALSKVKEKIGIDEKDMMLVENSKRYSLFSMLTVIQDFGVRSMSMQDIIYPYWENVARYHEDVLAILYIFKTIIIMIPIVILTILLIKMYRNRKWHWRDSFNLLKYVVNKIFSFFKNKVIPFLKSPKRDKKI